jgi:hypothetical protein
LSYKDYAKDILEQQAWRLTELDMPWLATRDGAALASDTHRGCVTLHGA